MMILQRTMLSVVVLGIALGAGAQGATQDLEQIQTILERIATALEEQNRLQRENLVNQRLSAAVDYLQFRSRRIEELESEIRTTEKARNATEDQIERIEKQIEEFENRLADANQDDRRSFESFLDRAPKMLEGQRHRLDRHDTRILELENEILSDRRDLQELEDFVSEEITAGP